MDSKGMSWLLMLVSHHEVLKLLCTSTSLPYLGGVSDDFESHLRPECCKIRFHVEWLEDIPTLYKKNSFMLDGDIYIYIQIVVSCAVYTKWSSSK